MLNSQTISTNSTAAINPQLLRPLAIALLLVDHVTTASADVPNEQRHEIEHLLNFIANTPCTINRNGSLHSGEDALAHIKKKRAYFQNKITSTELFIEYSASKSTLSGMVYTVQCEGEQPTTTAQWLLSELARYRTLR